MEQAGRVAFGTRSPAEAGRVAHAQKLPDAGHGLMLGLNTLIGAVYRCYSADP